MDQKSHEKFKQRLADSEQAVEFVHDHLIKAGYDAAINPHTVAPTPEERLQHSDNGDISVNMKVEVRHMHLSWTCQEDYPYQACIVDNVQTYKRKPVPPYMYIYVSMDMTHYYAVYPACTRKQWFIERKYIHTDDLERDIYFIDKSLCRWGKFT